MGWSLISDAVSGLVSSIMAPVNEWQKRKTVKVEQEFEIDKLDHEAKLERAKASVALAKTGQTQEYDLDKQSQKNMKGSWKDEFILIVFMSPIILAFLPDYQPIIKSGFVAIEAMPKWYVAIVIGMVVVIYGLRGLLTAYLVRISK